MDSHLDAIRRVKGAPRGLRPGTDLGALIVGAVTGVDAVAKQVQVSIGGSDPLWVPALAGIYATGTKVRLQRSPLDGGRAFLCVGPLDAQPSIVTGVVTAVNAGTSTLTVTCLGSSFILPFVASTYSVSQVVHVLRDASAFGAPLIVLGPQGSFAGEGGSGGSGGSGNPGQTVTRQAIIGPQWSGSWRASQGRWDTWNTGSYGGRSSLWQGDQYGSGPMTGLATYGDQIVGLNAVTITSMIATVTRADSSVTTGKAATLQPSTNGSQPAGAPTVAGATATGAPVTPEQVTWITLPGTVYEGFRVGTYKGLATVGSDYGAFYGTARGNGMVLTIQYTAVA